MGRRDGAVTEDFPMQHGSLVNHLHSRMTKGEPEPVVGMGVTMLSYCDRSPGTIIAVDAKGFTVQADLYKRTDSNGISESQEYEYTPDPKGATYRYARVSRGTDKGKWQLGGKKNGGSIRLGHRERYWNPSL